MRGSYRIRKVDYGSKPAQGPSAGVAARVAPVASLPLPEAVMHGTVAGVMRAVLEVLGRARRSVS